jgi:hypothetical protein
MSEGVQWSEQIFEDLGMPTTTAVKTTTMLIDGIKVEMPESAARVVQGVLAKLQRQIAQDRKPGRTFIRNKRVREMTGLPNSSLYDLIERGNQAPLLRLRAREGFTLHASSAI